MSKVRGKYPIGRFNTRIRSSQAPFSKRFEDLEPIVDDGCDRVALKVQRLENREFADGKGLVEVSDSIPGRVEAQQRVQLFTALQRSQLVVDQIEAADLPELGVKVLDGRVIEVVVR